MARGAPALKEVAPAPLPKPESREETEEDGVGTEDVAGSEAEPQNQDGVGEGSEVEEEDGVGTEEVAGSEAESQEDKSSPKSP